MLQNKHKKPLRDEGELTVASSSNALVSDRPTQLENALNAFQNVLSVEDRKRLRQEMNVSCDASQILVFTAGLDAVNPNRRGKSIATKLHSILETVQRFSEVAGIYVSSNPEIAALVWGSVRLAFTVLANFTSFFQTFADLLSGFDTLTPQFKEYQILFPDSLPLRNSIYDFHSAIISCCTKVISLAQRTLSQKLLASITSSFESEIGPKVTEIREKGKIVKSQAALAKAQDDKKERKWNSLLLKLSSYDHASAFNHARGKMHKGTAEWIFNTSEFRDWHESPDSRVLAISGKIGSGKTILTANVISRLVQKLSSTCSVSYLIVRFDNEKSQSADIILRSLVSQALAGRQAMASLKELLESSASRSFERSSLLLLLGHSISLLDKTFLVVDGLDQCSQREQRSLLQAFAELKHMCDGHGDVKILISVRESIAKGVDQALAPTQHLRVGLADTNADLARYAEEILLEKRNNGELVVRDETIMSQIMDKLRTGGEGMFLWVFLTVEEICSCPTDSDIRQTLEILPRKLSDTFDRALRRIQSYNSSSIVDIVQRTFGWVAIVQRPLTRWELGEVLGVKILQKSSIKDQIINGTERFPTWCENLVQIEAGDETVRFFHHSIKTHLLDVKLNLKPPELAAFHIDSEALDHRIGEVCLTYLNFHDFDRALMEFSPHINSLGVGQMVLSDEGRNIPIAVRNETTLKALPRTGRQIAVRFLRRFPMSKISGERFRVSEDVSRSDDGPDFSEFFSGYPFLLYATNFWFHHTFHLHQSRTKTWNLWKRQVDKSIFRDDKFWADFGKQPPGFETFDPKNCPVDESDAVAKTSTNSVSENTVLDTERVALHKAIIFADFIGHEPLMAYALETIIDRRYNLSPEILEQLLPSRRVFRFRREREELIGYENSHDGLISLVTEYVAWGGPMWPPTQFLRFDDPCDLTCQGKPLHQDMLEILYDTGYSRAEKWDLQLFAKIAVYKFNKEMPDAIETWISSKKSCIHEFWTRCDGEDLINDILTHISPSFDLGGWVFDLHKKCVNSCGEKCNYWRDRLHEAIENFNMIKVEFYLQESKAALEEEKGYCGVDFDLLWNIADSHALPNDFRSQAISIAIPEAARERKFRAFYEFRRIIISGHWDIAVALSSHGAKLADSMPDDDEERSWFQVLDDVLDCILHSSTPDCTQGWAILENETKATLELCVHHTSESKRVWRKPYPPLGDIDTEIFESLHDLAYPPRCHSP